MFHSVCALGLFAGAVSLAYYAEFTRDFIGAEGNSSAVDDILQSLADALGASAVSIYTCTHILINTHSM